MTRSPTELVLDSRTMGGPDRYRFDTDDGLCSPDSFRTADLLLLDALWDRSPDRLLVPRANYGVVGVVLSHAGSDVTMTETSSRARNYCARNIARNDADAAVTLVADLVSPGRDDCPAIDGEFDAAAYAPRPYVPVAVGKQRIADSLTALEPGGTLFVAATTESGGNRYANCLRNVATGVEVVAHRCGCEVLAATRPAVFEPPTYVDPRTLKASVDGVSLSLHTVPGLFAATGVDHGTRLLAEAADVADGDRVLDCCCGYGTLGAYAATVADCEVWLTDDDAVATACAERSLAESDAAGTVVTADGTAGVAGEVFETVLCNPPTHAGDRVLNDLFAGVRGVLAPDGVLWVVHHRSLDLSTHFRAFSTVETAAHGREHVVRRVSD